MDRIAKFHRDIGCPADIAFKTGLAVGLLTYVILKRRIKG